MIPTPGRIVEYTLGQQDVHTITEQRKDQIGSGREPKNYGNDPRLGDRYPLVITRVFDAENNGKVNGQVLLDGNDTLWVTSRQGGGDGDTQYFWRPFPRVKETQS